MNDWKNTVKRAVKTFVQAALGYLVAALGTAWELPTNKMYYFSSAGTWLECGAGGD